MLYQIILEGFLKDSMTDYFYPMKPCHYKNGTTLLSGNIQDQAELFGILTKTRNLNMALVSVRQIKQYERI